MHTTDATLTLDFVVYVQLLSKQQLGVLGVLLRTNSHGVAVQHCHICGGGGCSGQTSTEWKYSQTRIHPTQSSFTSHVQHYCHHVSLWSFLDLCCLYCHYTGNSASSTNPLHHLLLFPRLWNLHFLLSLQPRGARVMEGAAQLWPIQVKISTPF